MTYLLINIGAIIIPLLFSFDPRFGFVRKWPLVFIVLLIQGTFFIAWDAWYTSLGIWSFNNQHLVGIHIFGLPLEEILFFVCIPFCLLFLHEVLRYFLPEWKMGAWMDMLLIAAIIFLSVLAVSSNGLAYTQVVSLLGAAALITVRLTLPRSVTERLFLLFPLHLFFFYIVNGLLTAFPVVMYDDTENLALRVFTIPVEDHIYSLLMLWSYVGTYEALLMRYGRPTSASVSPA
ncbi:MAG: lycopene cyclase domain-containing protein [Flavobacteriales bacterium]|nr:lycopene cyclase domain-containing protein [Flavobacteriales bacterium]